MLVYILICLSLSLAGVAGLQFFYMMYLDRISKARQNHLRELEKHCKNLTIRLKKAEQKIIEQNDLIDSVYEEEKETEEVWADLIEEG
jgi:16S rRNA C1402 (ribose-2'-O) methylase RsmI